MYESTFVIDTMGCFMLHDRSAKPEVQRFQIFVSLLLSPQTKDERTAVAVQVDLSKFDMDYRDFFRTCANMD